MRAAVGVALLVLAATAPAQVRWTDRTARPGSYDLVHDPVHGRLYSLSQRSDRTCVPVEWDGRTWSSRLEWRTPFSLFSPRLAWDAAGARLLIYGLRFENWAYVPGTWVLDGGAWRPIDGPQPSARYGQAILVDTVRRRLLMYAGSPDMGYHGLDDLWEFDGSAWQPVVLPDRPPARAWCHLAFDAARDRLVLFGGVANHSTYLADHWELDAGGWKQVLGSPGPPPRAAGAMAFDPGRRRTVLFGGRDFFRDFGDTWEWDGTVWTQVRGQSPPRQSFPALAFDPEADALVLLEGTVQQTNVGHGALWSYDGTWRRVVAPTWPAGRTGKPFMATDRTRGRVVLFGGSGYPGTTWEWDGRRWLGTPAPPFPMYEVGLVHDTSRARMVAILIQAYAPGTTWEWDGRSWTQNTNAPVTFNLGPVAYDERRGRTVVLAPDGVTWEYDGSVWSSRTTANVPTAILEAAMAFDPIDRRLLLFGGYDLVTYRDETWSYDGTDWTRLDPVVSPAPRGRHSMAHDHSRRRVLLYGGATLDNRPLGDLWEWTGRSWRRLHSATTAPPERFLAGLAFDPVGGEMLLFGGGPGIGSEMWSVVGEEPAALDRFGSGCSGTAGTPLLRSADGVGPWLGQFFAVDVDPVPPGEQAVLLIGLSAERWGNVTLPLALDPFGAPGCTLLTAIDSVQPMQAIASTGSRFEIVICDCPNGVGREFFLQAAVFDAGANPLGAVFSNGLAGTLGRL